MPDEPDDRSELEEPCYLREWTDGAFCEDCEDEECHNRGRPYCGAKEE